MKTVFLNIERINYDQKMDLSIFAEDVTYYADSKEDEIIERVKGNTIVVSKELPLQGTLIDQFPDEVRMICEAGTGYNNIDLDACRRKGIMVCNTPAYSTHRVAHTAIMLMMNLSSSMQKQLRMLYQGDHSNFTHHMSVDHVELNGKTLGIIGAGNIGMQVKRIALAMDMRILIYTRTPKEAEEGVCYVSKEELLKESDFVSLHCPLSDATYHMIDAEALALMKKSAYLINTSRGALIDEEALIRALQNHDIAGAGLDVQEQEPMREDHPFYTMEEVIITPHMGWRGLETRQRLLQLVAGNITAFEEGQPIHVVVPA